MKDYQKLFNERLNERIGGLPFAPFDTQIFRKHIYAALLNIPFFSLGITRKEYNELVIASGVDTAEITMQQAFNALNVLKLATPTQLMINISEYSHLCLIIENAFEEWSKIAEPHIQAVRDEVNTEAKEDAQKEQVRKNIIAGGHKGLAKNISLA